MGEVYLTTAQVCEKLHVNQSTIWRWRKSGILPAYGLQGKVLFKASDVEAIIQRID